MVLLEMPPIFFVAIRVIVLIFCAVSTVAISINVMDRVLDCTLDGLLPLELSVVGERNSGGGLGVTLEDGVSSGDVNVRKVPTNTI